MVKNFYIIQRDLGLSEKKVIESYRKKSYDKKVIEKKLQTVIEKKVMTKKL